MGTKFGCIKKIRCDYQYEPVCGSDNQRYINPCHLIKEACLSRTAIIKVIDVPKSHFGDCSELRFVSPHHFIEISAVDFAINPD